MGKPSRRKLTLREWEPKEVQLPVEEAAVLRDGPGHIEVVSLGEDRYRVTPSRYIGSMALPETDVLILPKVEIRRLFFLLGYTMQLQFDEDVVPLGQSPEVTETLIRAFLGLTRLALRRGPLHAYRATDESLTTVRGRIRLLNQARRRYAMPLPIEVSYDEFTADIAENQLLKAALRRAERIRLRNSDLRPRIRENLNALDEVSEVAVEGRTLAPIPTTRLNRHYEQAMGLARLIVSSATTNLVHGTVRVPSFLLDMDKVFEDFVFRSIGDALNLRRGRWKQGRSTKLDVSGRVTIKPDFSVWIGERCVFVADAKYKVAAFGEREDLYQVLSYARATALPETLLIYASASLAADQHVVRNDGTVIHVRSIDLEAPDDEILKGIAGMARLVERIAYARLQALAGHDDHDVRPTA